MFPVWVYGLITANGQPLAGASVRTSLGVTANALPTGNYLMVHPAGTFNMTASAPGHAPATKNGVGMGSGSAVQVNFEL
ncbi:MAG: carboxypeptidase regulatory-like domain-containing protein [Desulfobacterales bacterium]|nr:carboxypeptidase regulatory-like domain-containing protein [Desulfobacterales bacterium]